MTIDSSAEGLLSKLASSLESAADSLPAAEALLPPPDGISLLDIKTELFLSYLQNLVFLIIIKLRNRSEHSNTLTTQVHGSENNFDDKVVKKLVELRIYLEKGVRPLEGRLKYQIDKILRAADSAVRDSAQKPNGHSRTTARTHNKSGGQALADGSGHQDSDAASDEIDELSYRPNPAAFARPGKPTARPHNAQPSKPDGIYRPPRITPTALPTHARGETLKSRKPVRSAAVDEFISTEMSSAPMPEASIGSTIISGGRKSRSQKERDEDAERRVYEESNFMRLPKESRKERLKKGKGGVKDALHGGEELRGLNEGLDRVNRAMGGKRSAGRAGGGASAGARMTEDGPRGSGFGGDGRAGKRRKVR